MSKLTKADQQLFETTALSKLHDLLLQRMMGNMLKAKLITADELEETLREFFKIAGETSQDVPQFMATMKGWAKIGGFDVGMQRIRDAHERSE